MTENAIHDYLSRGWSYIQTAKTHEFFAPRGQQKIVYSKQYPMLRLDIYPKEEMSNAQLENSQKSLF